jgi:hypothetical protein
VPKFKRTITMHARYKGQLCSRRKVTFEIEAETAESAFGHAQDMINYLRSGFHDPAEWLKAFQEDAEKQQAKQRRKHAK